MKTLWILLAAAAPLALSGCGGQASSDSPNGASGDQTEDNADDEPSDEANEEGEDAEDELSQDEIPDDEVPEDELPDEEAEAEAEQNPLEPDEDPDEISESSGEDASEQLVATAEEVGVDLRDADGDGDIDEEDFVELVKEQFPDVEEEELDLTGDGVFDEEDVEMLTELIAEQDETPGDVSVSMASPASAPVAVTPGVMTSPPRGIPIAPGSTGTGIPDLGECEQDYRSSAPEYCEVGYRCDAGYMYGNCWDQGGGVLYCDCGGEGETGYGYANYQLTEVSTADACETLMDLCTSEVQPEFSGEPECVNEHQSASAEWCDMTLRCSQSAELEGGATALLSEYESVSCGQTEDGSTQCQCYADGSTVVFELDGGEGLESCITALDVCNSIETVETVGGADCEVQYQSASTGWCDAQLACTKSALANGVELEVAESSSVNCQMVSEGVWACACNSSTSSSSFELQSEASAWDTCTDAVAMCGAGG